MRARRRTLAALAAAALAAGTAPAAIAWDGNGHQTVAAIAWEEMRPETRRRAAELLAAARPGIGLAELATAGLPRSERGRRHFLLAATWPDRVEDGPHDRPTWHWINRFWREGPEGPVEVSPPFPQPEENVLERLGALSRVLADDELPADRRAVALAWLLHLAGDVHQPLHTSAHVTGHPDERSGDRGGNTFELHREPGRDEPVDLHAYWDRLLTTSLPRRPGEPRAAWIDRAAAELARRHPGASLGDLAPGDFEQWVEEGLALAQTTVYRHGLRRGERPPEEYREAAWAAAAPAIVKAGHRLAALLDEALREEEITLLDSTLAQGASIWDRLWEVFALLGGGAFFWRVVDLYRGRSRISLAELRYDPTEKCLVAEMDNNGMTRILFERRALLCGISMGEQKAPRGWINPLVRMEMRLEGDRSINPHSSQLIKLVQESGEHDDKEVTWMVFPRLTLYFSNRRRSLTLRFVTTDFREEDMTYTFVEKGFCRYWWGFWRRRANAWRRSRARVKRAHGID